MGSPHFFLPIFRFRGRRWRVRWRIINQFVFARQVDRFEGGMAAYRFWVGPLLITALAD